MGWNGYSGRWSAYQRLRSNQWVEIPFITLRDRAAFHRSVALMLTLIFRGFVICSLFSPGGPWLFWIPPAVIGWPI
jgi:hypothetical protein